MPIYYINVVLLKLNRYALYINTKISPFVNLYENPLSTKNQGHTCPNYQMGVSDPIFEQYPPNLVRIDIGISFYDAEIFIMISQTVSDLTNISECVLSIS